MPLLRLRSIMQMKVAARLSHNSDCGRRVHRPQANARTINTAQVCATTRREGCASRAYVLMWWWRARAMHLRAVLLLRRALVFAQRRDVMLDHPCQSRALPAWYRPHGLAHDRDAAGDVALHDARDRGGEELIVDGRDRLEHGEVPASATSEWARFCYIPVTARAAAKGDGASRANACADVDAPRRRRS